MSDFKKSSRYKKNKTWMRGCFFSLIAAVGILIIICTALSVRLHAVSEELEQYKNGSKTTGSSAVSNAGGHGNTAEEQEVSGEASTQQSTQAEDGTKASSEPVSKEQPSAAEVVAPASDAGKKVYLTFDDGPSERTDEVLDILKKYNVKATFFVVAPREKGSEESYKERYRRIVNEGHTLAIHSYTHDYIKIYKDIDTFSKDVLTMQQYIYDITGYKPTVYRFPGGSSNSYFKQNVTVRQCIDWLTANGFTYYDWNVSSGDANNVPPSAAQILNNIFVGNYSVSTQKNPVVLMHDSRTKTTTVEALPQIIERIKALGYEIAPITSDSTPVHHRE